MQRLPARLLGSLPFWNALSEGLPASRKLGCSLGHEAAVQLQGSSVVRCYGTCVHQRAVSIGQQSYVGPDVLRASLGSIGQLQLLLQAPFSSFTTYSRAFTSTTHQQQQQEAKPAQSAARDSLELTQERINAITDKIPQRPVGVVEGTSYTLIILAAFGVLAFVLYQFVMNFILEPTALQCFNHTLDLLKTDPRITVRLGAADDIRAWGSNSSSRVARQQVPHQIYKDAHGTEHVRIQFYMRGPSGTGVVHADMYKDATKGTWAYTYLLVDCYTGNSQTPNRLYVVRPQ